MATQDRDKVGDVFWLAIHEWEVEVEVLEINCYGHATKLKAVDPDPSLGKIGFFIDDNNDYILFDLIILNPN